MIIDAHTHVWPDKIAARNLGDSPSDLKRIGDGTAGSLAKSMERSGVERSVCLGVGVNPEQVHKANRFAGRLDPERFIGFGSIHPGMTPEENVESLRANNLPGAKVHPLFQGFGLDDQGLISVLDAMRGEFAVIIHVGAGGEHTAGENCTPPMLAELVRQLPGLDIIACHFGGYKLFDQARELICGLPVYVDTSWPVTLGDVPTADVREYVQKHGPERVIFASDWPMADPAAEIEVIRGLDLSEEETTGILGGNFARVIGLAG